MPRETFEALRRSFNTGSLAEALTHTAWRADKIATTEFATAGMRVGADLEHAARQALGVLHSKIDRTSPFQIGSAAARDAESTLSFVVKAQSEVPRWHPQPPDYSHSLGMRDDYSDLYQFAAAENMSSLAIGPPTNVDKTDASLHPMASGIWRRRVIRAVSTESRASAQLESALAWTGKTLYPVPGVVAGTTLVSNQRDI